MNSLTQEELSTLIEIMRKLEMGGVFTLPVLDGYVMFDRRKAAR